MSQPAAVLSASVARSSSRCQLCNSIPRLPSGSSRLCSGPATKPSSEIDIWHVVSCMKHPSSLSGLVSPPIAPAVDVSARIVAEVGRADDEDLEAFRSGLVASPHPGRDAHRVPFLELEDLVVDFHPPAPAQDYVHLLLLSVGVAVGEATSGRDALVAQGALLELERLGRRAELQVGRAVEHGADVLQILLDVPERERHGRDRRGYAAA